MATEDDNQDLPESKSERKRQMTALQELGEALLKLKPAHLQKMPLSDKLRDAIATYHRLPNRNEARRRQLQFIGKVMRSEDHEAIQSELDRLLTPDARQAGRSREIERWCLRLSEGDGDVIEAFLDAYPSAERQPLRQLVRRHQQQVQSETGSDAAIKKSRRQLLNYVGEHIQL
jgi:ribosome-associated protein